MKILFVASESYPFIKVGGLGDVAYALPKALKRLGADARVIIPNYEDIPEEFKEKMELVDEFTVKLSWRKQYCGLKTLLYDNIPFYFIDNEYYFKRHGEYGYFDDAERFAFFDKAVLEAINHMGDFVPDVIHCNDWHTGMVAPFLKEMRLSNPLYNDIKTMFTIHNLKFQGVFPRGIVGDILGLNEYYLGDDNLEYCYNISFMKGGLNYSDILTTVSESYCEEVKDPYYGEGLDGVLRKWSDKFHGIVNGIDTEIFNPETDKKIDFNYSVNKLEGKAKNKLALQKQLKLEVNSEIPLIGMVTRLTSQKGLDLVECVLNDLLKQKVQVVVLGTGEEKYEGFFKYMASVHPDKVSANIFFDGKLAQKIYAGSDMFLMPSQFEPCGIGQLIALKYGSIPIVRETGGLKDTVKPYNKYTGEGNGFAFLNYNAHDMLYTIESAIELYKDKEFWTEMIKSAMAEDNSWVKSAEKYLQLYKSLKLT